MSESHKQPVELMILCTVRQAAEAMQVSERTVWNLIERGDLWSVKIANTRRVPLDEIRKLAARPATTTEPA